MRDAAAARESVASRLHETATEPDVLFQMLSVAVVMLGIATIVSLLALRTP